MQNGNRRYKKWGIGKIKHCNTKKENLIHALLIHDVYGFVAHETHRRKRPHPSRLHNVIGCFFRTGGLMMASIINPLVLVHERKNSPIPPAEYHVSYFT
jgi:hypothetical protein